MQGSAMVRCMPEMIAQADLDNSSLEASSRARTHHVLQPPIMEPVKMLLRLIL